MWHHFRFFFLNLVPLGNSKQYLIPGPHPIHIFLEMFVPYEVLVHFIGLISDWNWGARNRAKSTPPRLQNKQRQIYKGVLGSGSWAPTFPYWNNTFINPPCLASASLPRIYWKIISSQNNIDERLGISLQKINELTQYYCSR